MRAVLDVSLTEGDRCRFPFSWISGVRFDAREVLRTRLSWMFAGSRVSRRLRYVVGAVTIVGLLCGLALMAPGAALAVAPMTWSAPVAIVHDPPGSAGGNELGAISCPSLTFCAATDAFGSVVTSQHPAAGPRAWSAAPIDAIGLRDISCASISLCVAVDAEPSILVATRTIGHAARWRRTPLALPTSGANSPEALGVSCSSRSFCVVVGNQPVCNPPPFHGCEAGLGFVATSHDPSGGMRSWSIVALPPARAALAAVSCPARKLCIAIDGNGGLDAATRPAAGPTAWRTVAKDPEGPTAVTCPTVTFCVASTYDGGVMTSRHPTVKGSWKFAHVDAKPLNDISCASVQLCVAVDLAGNALTSTRPAGEPARWKLTAIDRANHIDPGFNPLSVACPSVRLCVAVDQTGHALIARPRKRS